MAFATYSLRLTHRKGSTFRAIDVMQQACHAVRMDPAAFFAVTGGMVSIAACGLAAYCWKQFDTIENRLFRRIETEFQNAELALSGVRERCQTILDDAEHRRRVVVARGARATAAEAAEPPSREQMKADVRARLTTVKGSA